MRDKRAPQETLQRCQRAAAPLSQSFPDVASRSAMARVLAPLIEFFWAGVAALLIASAALVAIARLALPEVDTQREVLAAWFSATVGRPVTLGRIDASWSGWAPRISVTGVTVFDETGHDELIRFERATLNIAPLDSLASLALQPQSLVVAGVTLTLLRDSDGRFSVAGMPPPESPIVEWLLEQHNFAMTEADLTIIDEQSRQTYALTDFTVLIRRAGDTTRVAGSGALPAALGQRLAFELETDRNPFDAAWSGTADIRLDAVDSDFLVGQLALDAVDLAPASLDFRAWTHWRNGQLDGAEFELDANDRSVTPVLARLSARGRLRRRSSGWSLQVADLSLPTLGPLPALAAFSAAWEMGDDNIERLAVRANELPVAFLTALAGALAPLPPPQREAVRMADATGMIKHLTALWRPSAQAPPAYYVDADVNTLAANLGTAGAAVEGLGFSTRFNAAGGYLRFAENRARITAESRLVAPLDLAGLHGDLEWHWNEGHGLDLQTAQLRGATPASTFVIDGRLDDALASSRHADVTMHFEPTNASRLHELLPQGVLPERGEQWARNVIQAGTVRAGRIHFDGPLAAYPFDPDESAFEVDFKVENATLRYARNWPLARALDGEVAIRGRTATMTVARGKVLDADITRARIELPDLHVLERTLSLRGTAQGPAQSATDIIMASPLKASKAARLQELDIHGALEVTLDMNIALYPDGPREVLGQARFAGNRIIAERHGITLDDVHGVVSFTREDWYGEGLRALFDNTPVELVVNGGLDDPNYDSEFRMTGRSPAHTLVDYLDRYVPTAHHWLERHASLDAMTGELPWKAVLTIPVATPGKALPAQRLTLESNLRGLAVGLPWPFGKAARERQPLRLEFALRGGRAERTRIDLGDTLAAEIEMQGMADGKPKLQRVEVFFGTPEPVFSGAPGIRLGGYIQHLPLGEWTRFLNRAGSDSPAPDAGLPLAFDVEISQLELVGQDFDDVRLRGQRHAERWDVQIEAAEISGQLSLPRDVRRGPLEVKLDKLHVSPRRTETGTAGVGRPDPRRLPALAIDVADFRFGDIPLGTARITTSRREGGQRLEDLNFHDEGFALQASGDWLQDDAGHRSRFDIAVESAALAQLLGRFGYTMGNIKGGRTAITLDANWAGAPMDFTLAAMSGSFELHVENGRILDVDPGGGRLFGLLSLQALPRRLSLDFDDLFRKGFAFDNIDGVFMLENGNAYTNSLSMTGPSATIDVAGRAGLAARDYDQRVVVTPALSDTLPVAGALFGPIGAGVGAVYFLGQKLFKSIPENVNKLLSREYLVTGSWDDPIIEKL
ncbi:MAG: YhdP family protein [Gammaproteobacteria bacterium]